MYKIIRTITKFSDASQQKIIDVESTCVSHFLTSKEESIAYLDRRIRKDLNLGEEKFLRITMETTDYSISVYDNVLYKYEIEKVEITADIIRETQSTPFVDIFDVKENVEILCFQIYEEAKKDKNLRKHSVGFVFDDDELLLKYETELIRRGFKVKRNRINYFGFYHNELIISWK